MSLHIPEMHHAMRLNEQLHVIAVDEVGKLVQGSLTGSLHSSIRAQQAVHRVHRVG